MTCNSLRKVLFPVTGFGACILPATNTMPWELLPIVGKPFKMLMIAQTATGIGALSLLDAAILVGRREERSFGDLRPAWSILRRLVRKGSGS